MLFDKDNSGSIDVYELKDAMKALGIYLTRDQAKKLMAEVDYDGSGTIELDEFQKLIGDKIQGRNEEDEVRKIFRVYDDDDTGTISFDNLKKMANEMDPNLTEDDIRGMIYEADLNRDGKVDIEEFVKLMRIAK
eukprot:CAMPEP_0170547560 /NCGR_PEP_ID=MMETSP0211-20121228/5972_1 /TAXON_ID=311385 /ORGANISM="Pseudokeronopsis sp., Strain OXSARD2" /LENGTH=133 /DNA_ID=CAMNT_0010852689 /DNA_START=220 /DNA_END=618 /DNA_ORIENTATION=+